MKAKTKLLTAISLLAILLYISCKSKPVFPIEPKLTFVDIQPKNVREFRDTITITFEFTDGDGDLGDTQITERQSIKIKDQRIIDGVQVLPDSISITYFGMPDLNPNTKNPSIRGKITLTYGNTARSLEARRRGMDEEEAFYTIWVTDRAGHRSDSINTAPIVIRK